MCRVECLFSSQLAPVPIYCLVNRGTCANNLNVKRRGRESNLRPHGYRSDALTPTTAHKFRNEYQKKKTVRKKERWSVVNGQPNTVHLKEWKQHWDVVIESKHCDDGIATRWSKCYWVQTVQNGQLLCIVNVLLNSFCFNTPTTVSRYIITTSWTFPFDGLAHSCLSVMYDIYCSIESLLNATSNGSHGS